MNGNWMRNLRKNIIDLDKLPKLLLIFALCFLSFNYGLAVQQYQLFPYALMVQAKEGLNMILPNGDEWHYHETHYTSKVPTHDPNTAYPGLSLITSVAGDNRLAVSIIDMDGTTIHEWNIDWFAMWPDATHVPKSDLPKKRPGVHVHGAELLENGDLVFNFDYFGLVRLDICGNTVWRLPYRTHHSIYQDENGILWVPGQRDHEEPLPDFPNYKPPVEEPTVLKISPQGKILGEISILDVLKQNKLQALLNMYSKRNPDDDDTTVSGDIFHLNDVETFPNSLPEGAFNAGDIMLSLRNINTILVFRERDLKVTHVVTGDFVRQHDPDFIDGNTISIFDNNNVEADEQGHQSRIVLQSFTDNDSHIYYAGNPQNPFFTHIMGKHQWLPNGNLLITESMKGRAFEIDEQGIIVWEYINLVEDGYIGIVEEAQRLPNTFTKAFVEQRTQKCTPTTLN